MKRIIKKTILNYRLFFLAVSLCLVASAIVVYIYGSKKIKSSLQTELQGIAEMKVHLFSNWIDERTNDANMIMQNPRLSEDLEQWMVDRWNNEKKQLIIDRIKMVNSSKIYDEIMMFDSGGRGMMLIDGAKIDSAGAIKEAVLKAKESKQIIWSDFYFCEECVKEEIEIFVPLRSFKKTGEKIIAVLLLRVDARKYLDPFIESWPVPSRTSEVLILRPDEFKRFKTIKYSQKTSTDSLSLEKGIPVYENKIIIGDFIYRDTKVIAAIKKIPGKAWYIVAKTDQSEGYASLRNLTVVVVYSCGFMLLLMAILNMLIEISQKKDLYKRQYEMELEQKALIKHFDYITKYANDIIFLVDEKWRIIQANDRAIKTYGYDYEEMLNLTAVDFRAPETRESLTADFREASVKGGTIFETVHQRKDGSIFPVEISLRSIKIEHKKYFQAIIRDITERKKTEVAIRESEEKFYSAFHASPVAMGISDLETGKYIEINEMFVKLSGRKRDEIIGFTTKDIDLWARLEDRDKFFKVLSVNGNLNDYPADFKTKDGKILNFLVSATVTLINEKKCLLFTTVNITDRLQMENKLKIGEERYRNLFDNNNDAIYVHELTPNGPGRFIEVNRKAEQMLGYSRSELLGMTMHDITTWEHQTSLPETGRQLLEKKHIVFEAEGVTKKGERIPSEVSLHLIELDGKPAGMAVVRDITEKRAAEDALRESEQRFRTVAQSANDAIIAADKDGNIVFWNNAAHAIYGYDQQEALGRPLTILMPEQYRKAHENRIAKLQANGDAPVVGRVIVSEGLRKDGSVFPAEYSVSSWQTKEGKYFTAIVRDITERKRNEKLQTVLYAIAQAAQSSIDLNELYKHIHEIVSELLPIKNIYIALVSNDGNTLSFPYYVDEVDPNPGTRPLGTGLTEYVLKTRSPLLVTPQIYAEMFEQGKIRAVGTFKHNWMGVPLMIEGKAIGVLAVQSYDENKRYTDKDKDVLVYMSDHIAAAIFRKRNQDALQESEEKYRRLYEDANIGIYRTTPDGRILLGNPSLVKMLGYDSFEDLARVNVEQSGYVKRESRKEFKQIIETQGAVVGWEAEWRKKDGKSVFVRENARAIYGKDGRLAYYDGVIEDITEGRDAKKSLELSEYRYRTTLDAVNEMIHVIDRDYNILLMNRSFSDYCRNNEICEQCVGKKVFEIFPFLPQSVRNEYEKCFQTNEPVLSEDINIVNGKEIVTTTRKIPILENGKAARIVTVIVDITDVRKQEEAVKESQEKYRSIFDNSKEGIFLMDGPVFIDCNQALLDMFGLKSREEIIGKTPGQTSPEYQDNEKLSSEYAKQLIDGAYSGKIMRFDWKHLKKSGEVFDCEISLSRLELKGKFYLMAIIRDVTEKKKIENRIRGDEQRYSIIINKTGQLVYDYDVASGNINWIGAVKEVTGFNIEEMNKIDIKTWESRIHPDDREIVLLQLERSMEAVGSFDFEYRFKRKDGQYAYVLDHGIFIPGRNGQAVKMLGTMADISEKKKIEMALRQSEERYKTLFADTLEPQSITKKGLISDVNTAWLKLHKYSYKDEVIGKDILQVVMPEDRKIIEDRRGLTYASDKERRFEARDLTKTGDIIDVEISSSTIYIDGEEVILSAVNNITQRKISEKKIRELNRRFEYVLGATKTGFDIIDSEYNIVYVDPSWEKHYGSPDGVKCHKYFMERDTPCENCGITAAVKTNKTVITEEYLVKEKRWIEVHTIPFQDEDGKWLVAEFNIDITDRKHDQEILENRQKALQEVYKIATSLDESFQGICNRVAGNLAEILKVPHMAVQLLKGGMINVVSYYAEGKMQNDIVMPLAGTPCEKAYQKGEYVEINDSLRKLFPRFFLNTEYDLNSYFGLPIKDRKGKVLGLICLYDYKHHHFSPEELLLLEIFAHYLGYEIDRAEMETTIREADKGKLLSDIASGVAHEVRNPLHAIQAISEAMAQDIQDNPDYSEYLFHIKTQVNRLSQLMNELLELGKPIQTSMFKESSIYETIEISKKYWKDAQIKIENNIVIVNNVDQKKKINIDAAKIQEVVINLIENAAQHSPPQADIIIEIDQQGSDYLSVKIIDKGKGVKPQDIERVFEPFFTTRKKGTGLGLAICKRIIESHNGSIEIRNNENGPGCTVKFTLPIYGEEK